MIEWSEPFYPILGPYEQFYGRGPFPGKITFVSYEIIRRKKGGLFFAYYSHYVRPRSLGKGVKTLDAAKELCEKHRLSL